MPIALCYFTHRLPRTEQLKKKQKDVIFYVKTVNQKYTSQGDFF